MAFFPPFDNLTSLTVDKLTVNDTLDFGDMEADNLTVNGTTIFDGTDSEMVLVRQDGDSGDVWGVDTSTPQVFIGNDIWYVGRNNADDAWVNMWKITTMDFVGTDTEVHLSAGTSLSFGASLSSTPEFFIREEGDLFRVRSNDIDGVGTSGDLLTNSKGTQDVKFEGGVSSDGRSAPTTGLEADQIGINQSASNKLDITIDDTDNVNAINITNNDSSNQPASIKSTIQNQGGIFFSVDGPNGDTLQIKAADSQDDLEFNWQGSRILRFETGGRLSTFAGFTFADSPRISDDTMLALGSGDDYWFIYNTGGTEFRLRSSDIDGVGTTGDLLTVQDGTKDFGFAGGISTDGQSAPTSGISAGGDIQLNSSKITRTMARGDVAVSITDSGGNDLELSNASGQDDPEFTYAGQSYVRFDSSGQLQFNKKSKFNEKTVVSDDKLLGIGLDEDYWFIYNSGGTELQLRSADGDGVGTTLDIFTVQDGANDIAFAGGIATDGQAAPTSGITAGGDINGVANSALAFAIPESTDDNDAPNLTISAPNANQGSGSNLNGGDVVLDAGAGINSGDDGLISLQANGTQFGTLSGNSNSGVSLFVTTASGSPNGPIEFSYFDTDTNNVRTFFKINEIDAADNELNRLEVSPNVQGSTPSLDVTGGDTNIDLQLNPKGTGTVAVDATNISTDTTTGTQIATGTGQKIGFFGTTPVTQQGTGVSGASFTQNSGTTVNDASTFGGYTIKQLVQALQNYGIIA